MTTVMRQWISPSPSTSSAPDYTEVDISSNGFLSFNIGNELQRQLQLGVTPDDLGNPIPHDDAICETTSTAGAATPSSPPGSTTSTPASAATSTTRPSAPPPTSSSSSSSATSATSDCDDCEAGEGVTFEVILFEGSNDIKVQYMDTVFTDNPGADPDLMEEDNGQSATTGIDKDDTVGLGYSSTDPLTDNLAVLYTTNFGVPTEITLDPPTATNEIGSDHTVTTTVTDGAGLPIEQADVEFNVTDGPNTGDNNGQGTALDANGQATFTYTGDGGTGTDTIEACVVDFPELCTTATKTWTEAPPPSPTPTPTAVAEVVQAPAALPHRRRAHRRPAGLQLGPGLARPRHRRHRRARGRRRADPQVRPRPALAGGYTRNRPGPVSPPAPVLVLARPRRGDPLWSPACPFPYSSRL